MNIMIRMERLMTDSKILFARTYEGQNITGSRFIIRINFDSIYCQK